jgi:hypothetical protein
MDGTITAIQSDVKGIVHSDEHHLKRKVFHVRQLEGVETLSDELIGRRVRFEDTRVRDEERRACGGIGSISNLRLLD